RLLEIKKKLIELRRLNMSAGEHGVRLPAVMDLVLEEMGENAVDALLQLSFDTAIGDDFPRQIGVGEAVAKANETPVDLCLKRNQFRRVTEHTLVAEYGEAQPALFQRINVQIVDEVVVRERCGDRREERRARRDEVLGVEPGAGAQQDMVRPTIVARHGGKMIDEIHGSHGQAYRPVAPPSVLPDISPARGEIAPAVRAGPNWPCRRLSSA